MHSRACPRHRARPGNGIRKWIAFAMIAHQIAPPLGAHAALNQSGRWVATPSLGFSSTHTVVLREPVTNATKVFLFGESGTNQTMKFWRFFPGDTSLITPTTGGAYSSLDNLPHPAGGDTVDLFCSGHATLPTGEMVLVGGGWIPQWPCREVYTLNPAWQAGQPSPWTASAQMAVQRWYATATTLPSGKVLASAGTMASGMIGFGGLAQSVTTDTTWRVLQPLELSARVSWGDTTAAPGDTCTVTCNPPRFRYLLQPDNYTGGRYPPGRDAHAFVGDYGGRCLTFGGRQRLSNGAFEALGDAWHLYSSLARDDTSHGWSLLEQLGDPELTSGQDLPGPRWGCAATWAGVEDRQDTKLEEKTGALICFIHGGIDANGQVLGDLWRGERRVVTGPHYTWAWKRILAGDASTKRFGHTMTFDPGAPGSFGAKRSKLVIFGGWKSRTELADPAKLYCVGVGSESTQPETWREVTPSGTPPPARAWHAMASRWKPRNATVRRYFMFGGESGLSDSAATPVAPDFWFLQRNDQSPATEDAFTWLKYTANGPGPSGRSRPAMAYSIDDGSVVVVGGDTTGSAVAGGHSSAIWTVPAFYGPSTVTWHQPLRRDFHPAPPPISGMGMVALGEGKARVARSLEQFTSAANSPAGADCGPLFGQWQTITDPDSLSERPIADYPNIFVLPDGRLFNAGPTPSTDKSLPLSYYRRFFNLQTKRWEDPLPLGQQDTTFFGTSVMYRPGKFLRAGSTNRKGHARTETLDLALGSAWIPYQDSTLGAPDPNKPGLELRTHLNLTVLPTGDVLATGGIRDDDQFPLVPFKEPRVWSIANSRWNKTEPQLGEKLAPDPWVRNYHSTTVLLPDARILTAGGESPSPADDQTSASVFEPPYLFDGDSYAPRPRVQHGPDLLPYGRELTIRLTDSLRTGTIRSVALVRPGAATHSFDQGQRYVPLDFVPREGPKRLLIRGPVNANLAPPGDYMLFVVDDVSAGARTVPSVARWVRVLSTTAAVVDTGDATEPRGGSYIALSNQSTCPNYNADLTLGWVAPADDDTIAFSGLARAYNLRYKVNSDPEANFNAWAAVPTNAPGQLGAAEQAVLSGLSSAVWYRFQLKSVGDHADTSGLSNALVAKPQYCEDEGGGGSGGGGGGFGLRASGPASAQRIQAIGSFENTLFPGPLSGEPRRDALEFDITPRLANERRWVYVRQGSRRGLALDRARLVAVDHASGTETAMAPDGRFLAGVREPALTVMDRAGRDLALAAAGATEEPVYADSGEVLRVVLKTAPEDAERFLLLEASAGDGRGGIAVETSDADGVLLQLGRIHPRRQWSNTILPLAGSGELRLWFHGAYALRFIGALASSGEAATSQAALLSATGRGGSDELSRAAAEDGDQTVIAPDDTLHLSFADLPQGPAARDWYLVLEGTPLTAEVARDRAAASRGGALPPPIAYRLGQNVPNPFRLATWIPFDLPVTADIRLEVFDLQGRLMRRFSARRGAGRHMIEWDLRDSRRQTVPAGVYVYRLRANGFESRLKMVVMP